MRIRRIAAPCWCLLAALWGGATPVAAANLIYEGSVPMGEYIMLEAGEAFYQKYGVKFEAIYSNGTELALRSLEQGACQIAGVARSLTPDELKPGYTYQIIGYDAIAVFVNDENTADSLDLAQLRGVFSGAVGNWREVAGPDLPIRAVVDGTSGRTLNQEFIKRVMGGGFEAVERTAIPREHLLLASQDPRVITFDSLALKPAGTKVLSIGGFLPSKKNVRSGNYPLCRPLYLVVKGQPRGDVKKFMKFMLSSEGQKIVDKGFVRVK